MKNIAFVVATGLTAAAVSASPLLPGGSLSPVPVNGVTVNGGLALTPYTPSTFSSANFSGTLLSLVANNDPGNPWGLNALTFVYVVFNDTTSADDIGRFTVNGFTGFLTDAGVDPVIAPNTYVEAFEVNRSGDGLTIGWTFLDVGAFDQVGPGTQSNYFIVRTNATSYYWSDASVIDGAIATANAWAPLPTPGAGALLGLGALASLRRRR